MEAPSFPSVLVPDVVDEHVWEDVKDALSQTRYFSLKRATQGVGSGVIQPWVPVPREAMSSVTGGKGPFLGKWGVLKVRPFAPGIKGGQQPPRALARLEHTCRCPRESLGCHQEPLVWVAELLANF